MSTAIETREDLWRKIQELPPVQREQATQLAVQVYSQRHQYFASDPVGFFERVISDFIWSKQREIAEAVRDHRRVAVHACHGTGKSFIAGRIVAWFVATSEKSFVVTTAPTMDQVKAILWKEIRRAVVKGKLPGSLNITEWKVNDELVALGRKPADWDPAAFQGYHELQVLVILDEACGVPETIIDAASSLITNEDCRMLAIGNPDDPTSKFAKLCRIGSGWHVIHIGWKDTPNHPESTEEVPDELHKLLISRIWVEERTQEWGEDHPKYISKVLGLFPEDVADSVIPLSFLWRCAQPVERPTDPVGKVDLGVDVGAGGDFTSIRMIQGGRVGRVWHDHGTDTMTVVGKVLRIIQETGAQRVKIDSIGIGKGVVDRLKEERLLGTHNAEIFGVNVGERALNPEDYVRLRDQLWWECGRESAEDGRIDYSYLEEEDRDSLFAQLSAPKWKPDSRNRIKVEPKDETKKRLGRSPDDADALLLAYYVPPVEVPSYVTTAEPARISPV